MTLKLVPNGYDVVNDSGLVMTRTVTGADCSHASIVQVGPDPYAVARSGWFVYVVHGQVHAECLDADGTWSKYGTSFATAEGALEVLQAHPEGLD